MRADVIPEFVKRSLPESGGAFIIKPFIFWILTLTALGWAHNTVSADSGITLIRFEHFFGAKSIDRISLRIASIDDRTSLPTRGLEFPLYDGQQRYAASLKNQPRDIVFGFALGAAALGIAYAVARETEKDSRVAVRADFRTGDPAANQLSLK
ncbi:MAG: hypothetical protein OES09_16910 [Gammaproteobacteria bacterium]|nr:hypothetical protein [Gammaproteobacteria bacterium]